MTTATAELVAAPPVTNSPAKRDSILSGLSRVNLGERSAVSDGDRVMGQAFRAVRSRDFPQRAFRVIVSNRPTVGLQQDHGQE